MEFNSIPEALKEIAQGRLVIVVDDQDRENEGDLIVAAEKVTPEVINFMITYGKGLVCLALPGERLDELALGPMVQNNKEAHGTDFTVSVDAASRFGVTTGISVLDRAMTIRVMLDPQTRSGDLVRPGHVFPLRGKVGGVLRRAGHTEAAIDLARGKPISARVQVSPHKWYSIKSFCLFLISFLPARLWLALLPLWRKGALYR